MHGLLLCSPLDDLGKTAWRYKKTSLVAFIAFMFLISVLLAAPDPNPLGVFLGGFGVFLAVLFYSRKEEARRRKEFKRISEQLGMTFSAYPTMSDDERAYRTAEELAVQEMRDPLTGWRALLIRAGISTKGSAD